MFWHTSRMPDDRRPQVSVVVSTQAIAERLAQLPMRKEMYRAVLLRRLPRAVPRFAVPRLASMQIFWSLTAIASLFAIVFILTRPQAD
jgi:hypothetical protein